MGIFFKSKRSNKNSADNNIKISNSNNDDIKMMANVKKKERHSITSAFLF